MSPEAQLNHRHNIPIFEGPRTPPAADVLARGLWVKGRATPFSGVLVPAYKGPSLFIVALYSHEYGTLGRRS